MNFRTHIKETIKLAIPISLGQLGHVMMGVVDSLMVGKVGYTSLAAASLVNGLFFLVIVVGIGMTYASTPLIAIAKGSNNRSDCGKILNHSLIVNVAFSIILMLGTFSLSFLIPHLNQPKEVVREAVPYLQILTLSVIPFMVFQCYRQFLEGLSIPNPPMVIAILANLLNAFLNWIFIYGNLGFPAMGLSGAGVATTTTRFVMAATLMILTLKYVRVKIYEPKLKIKPIDNNLVKKLINIGLPSGFQYLLEVGAFSFGAIMIGWIGTKPLAAHQIAISLASATYMVILGIASAGTIRVGDAVGKKSIEQIRSAGFSAIGLASAVMLTCALIFFLFRNILPTFYNNNPEVIEIASVLLIIAGLFQLFDGLQATGIGILRGMTDVKIPLLISILSYWVIAIPISYLLGFVFNFGAAGIWIGLLLGLASLERETADRWRLRKPEIRVDPWGEGVILDLPAQQVPATMVYADPVWQVTAQETKAVRVHIHRTGFDWRTASESLPLSEPAETYEVSFTVDGETMRTWRYRGPSKDCPLLVFDEERGTLLTFQHTLPARRLGVIYPRKVDLQVQGDARLVEDLPRMPWGWAAYRGQVWDWRPDARLTLSENGNPVLNLVFRPDEAAQRPHLVGGERLMPQGPDNRSPVYVGSPPSIRIPLSGPRNAK